MAIKFGVCVNISKTAADVIKVFTGDKKSGGRFSRHQLVKNTLGLAFLRLMCEFERLLKHLI